MSITPPGWRDGDSAAIEADVIVVGAGPAGSATATHLARRGLDVALLEKTTFPREKVCGDGLTPRATRQLIRLGIDTSRGSGLAAQQGLADLRRGRAAVPAGVAGAERLPAVRAGPSAFRLRRPAGPARRRRGRPAVRRGQRHRAGHRRPDRPHRRRPDPRRPRLPGPGGHRRRRQLHPAQPRHGPGEAGRPADGRRGPHVLHAAPAATTTTSSPGWSCGTASRGRAICCRATAGSSAWATAAATSDSAS